MSVLTSKHVTCEINRVYALTGVCPPFLYLNILDFTEFRKSYGSRWAVWTAEAFGVDQMIYASDFGDVVFQPDRLFPRGRIWAGPGTLADYYARSILLGDENDDSTRW